MAIHPTRFTRRSFLASAAGLSLSGLAPAAGVHTRPAAPEPGGRTPLAVLGTVYRPLSCLYQLAGRFLHGYPADGRLHVPAQYVHTLWIDQVPENDLSRD